MAAPTVPVGLAGLAPRPSTDLEVRAAARFTGVGILALAVLSGFGVFVATRGLVTDGDAAKTARDIANSEGLFRAGILSLCGVAILDVLVAAGLHRTLRPANQALSRVAASFRVAYAAGFLVAIAQLLLAVRLVGDGAATGGSAAARVLAHVERFDDLWQLALLLFGIHLLLLGALIYRSGYVPRLVGALVAVAGVGYAFDSITSILTGAASNVGAVTFVGEAVLAVWLVLRGSRIRTGLGVPTV
jgi:hypothetical protein